MCFCACRMMLDKFNLTGETQERERILIPFSNRYHECNVPEYGSPGMLLLSVIAVDIYIKTG